MPATYTHYRFGRDVLKQPPDNIGETVVPYRDLYGIGLHEPDLLFYYKALKEDAINQTGVAMHDKPTREFFRPTRLAMDQASEPGPCPACLFGFICHFALDSSCHPYIKEKIRQTGITYSEIEAELDRALMMMDRHDPITWYPAGHLKVTRPNAQVIARFFPTVREKQIYRFIRSIRWYCNQLVAPQPWKRRLIYRLLKLGRSYGSVRGMIINYKPNPACAIIYTTLENLYLTAIPLAVELIISYQAYLLDDQKLDTRFGHTLGEFQENMRYPGIDSLDIFMPATEVKSCGFYRSRSLPCRG